MKRAIFNGVIVGIILGIIGGIFAGCNEQQLRRGDQIADRVGVGAQGVQAFLDTPAGQLIPPHLRLLAVLGTGLASGLVITWEEWRNRQMKKTAKAIVKGIEISERAKNPAPDVKKNIAAEMMNQGGQKFYDRANKIVDRLKIA